MKKKGKGLSFDQKRERMLGIFHKTKDVFNYQEIEKLSIKAGIPFPNVKDILNSLKADGLVECQKIGAGVFYWSFPSRAFQTMKQRLQATEKMISSLLQQNQKLITETDQGRQKREQGQKREEMKTEVVELRSECKELEHEIQKYIRFDPQRYQTLRNQSNKIERLQQRSTKKSTILNKQKNSSRKIRQESKIRKYRSVMRYLQRWRKNLYDLFFVFFMIGGVKEEA